MTFFSKNAIFDEKKAPAASRQPKKMVLFPEKRYFWEKKGACGKPPGGGKKFWSFFCKKKGACGKRPAGGEKNWSKFWSKKGACGKPPGGGKWFFPRETLFWAKKKAPPSEKKREKHKKKREKHEENREKHQNPLKTGPRRSYRDVS